MDLNPCMFPCRIFVDNERLCISGKIFQISTMLFRSVSSVSKEILLFMALEAYLPFVSKVNFVISSDSFFCLQEDSLQFSQTYIYDSNLTQQAQQRMSHYHDLLNINIVLSLQVIIYQYNPYIEAFPNGA
jgi:hypothetical protein